MSGIERLRAIAGAWDEWGLGGTLTEIADQIEQELARQDEPDSTDKGARLPYVTDEDREALEWVRKYGGIGCVQTMAAKLGDTLNWIRERAGISKYEVVDYDELLDALDRRLMPEGMEWLIEAWPKFEDDAPVKLGDMALIDGDVDMVEAVQIWIHGKPVIYGDNGSQQLEKGERVKRPSVPAADGEPLEVGQKVWDIESGEELKIEKLCDVGLVRLLTRDGVSRYVYPDQLTHTKPEPSDSRQAVVNEIGDEMAARIDLLVSSGRWSDAD